MPNYDHEALLRIAIEHADALCEHLAGDWHRTDAVQSRASIAREGCELYLWGYEHNGTARLSIQAQLPDGWGAVEGVTPPEITVGIDRGIESIAADIARRLLPIHAEMAARVRATLEQEQRRQAVSASIIDHFLATMPDGVPDLHHPGLAVHSSGPGPFSASLRLDHNAQTADLHLRSTPLPLSCSVIELIGGHFVDAESAEGSAEAALGQLADAITGLASKRQAMPLNRLLRESALNVLILGRVASTLLSDSADRERLEQLTDQLVTELRALAR